jgi:hypothetical protein
LPAPVSEKKSVEGIVTSSNGLVTWHLPIWLNTMLKAEKFPTRISDLHASLTNVDADSLTHGC